MHAYHKQHSVAASQSGAGRVIRFNQAKAMASTIQYSLIRKPELLDIVDEEWEKDVLPNDGTRQSGASLCTRLSNATIPPLHLPATPLRRGDAAGRSAATGRPGRPRQRAPGAGEVGGAWPEHTVVSLTGGAGRAAAAASPPLYPSRSSVAAEQR